MGTFTYTYFSTRKVGAANNVRYSLKQSFHGPRDLVGTDCRYFRCAEKRERKYSSEHSKNAPMLWQFRDETKIETDEMKNSSMFLSGNAKRLTYCVLDTMNRAEWGTMCHGAA